MSKLLLSVVVPTYNHEKYIKECIDSILMQKVNFEYEVLIGEDLSPDGTACVLKEMEPDLPDNVRIFYREKNMGLGKNGNARDLHSKAKGKYVVTIEGDDYFTDKCKLQKQVDFLEKHPEYFAVAHGCTVVDEHSKEKDEEYPDCPDLEYTYKHFMDGTMPGQLATVMYKNDYYPIETKFYYDYKLYDFFPGDRLKAFLMLTQGKIKIIRKKWSAYRHVTSGGSSYSANVKADDKYKRNELLFYKSLFNYSKENADNRAIKISGKMYFSVYLRRCLGKNSMCCKKDFVKDILKEKYTVSYLGYALKQCVKRIISR